MRDTGTPNASIPLGPEVGVKGLYLDGSLQLSTSYFYQDFDAH